MKQNNGDRELHQPEGNETPLLKANADICQQLMDRYGKSSATQHNHLLATAAAMRSILTSESLPLTPPAYFAAAISSLTSQTVDSTAVSALLTFLSIVVPVIPSNGITAEKASEAVGLLVELVNSEGEKLGMATLRCAVKCFGVLLVEFCDLEDWDSIRLGFQALLKFSIDKRPKVRRCAQECLEKILKSFQSSAVIEETSKLIYSMLRKHMPVAITLSSIRSVDGSNGDVMTKTEHTEAVHMINLMKLAIPKLSDKIRSESLTELCKLMSSEFSPLTRQILESIEVFFETSSNETVIPHLESIITPLAAYVSSGEKKPVDTLMSVATLLKDSLGKSCALESRSWMKDLPVVCGSLAGLLTYEASTASQASIILNEVIDRNLDPKAHSIVGDQSFADDSEKSEEANAIDSICAAFGRTLSSCEGIPNEHILAVISVLFNKLGTLSYNFMRSITLKLGGLMTLVSGDTSETNSLQNCIGVAVMAMGLEKILELLPISLHADDLTCSNIWLVPILKKHLVGASLEYYMEHITPLAKSFQRASRRVKKSDIAQELKVHARDLWGLLPAFCRYPTDTHLKFGSLAELLITYLNKYTFMHESIGIALQLLVNQNKCILGPLKGIGESNINTAEDAALKFGSLAVYSKKTATRNIRAMASCSIELLQALIDIIVDSRRRTSYLKGAIGCLASIMDSSITTKIFISLLEKFKLIDENGEFESQGSQTDESTDNEQHGSNTPEKHLHRCMVLDIASCLVVGAEKDLVDLIYKLIKHTFQGHDEIGHQEAYHTLSRILEEHSWFCSSHYVEVTDLLIGLKSPVDVSTLRRRFDCFHMLMLHAFKMSSDEDNDKAFLVLNEIIVTLKNAKEETRKVAYDILLMISTSLRSSSSDTADVHYQKLISMIMGYLSGSSPHIKSGAISALSVLVYQDSAICLSMPDFVSSLLSLLQSKTVEIIKAVLGFTKVIVSSLDAKSLHNLLSDIVNGILPWSSVSRNHFRSKVTVILEIMIRKCSSAAVKSVTPEKYKTFVKTIIENRHAKSSSKEGQTDSETVAADDSSQGPQKRKHTEHGNLPEENGSVEHKKRMRKPDYSTTGSNKTNVISSGDGGNGVKSGGRTRGFDKKNTRKFGSEGNRRKENDFAKGSVGDRKRKRETVEGGQSKARKEGQGKRSTPGSYSKFNKQKN